VSSLFTYYSQILKVHSLKDGSQGAIASALGINPYFVKDYLTAKTNYPLIKVIYIISLLREFDLKAKGVNSTANEGQLLKELTFKILHI
jgi:DNA polymerase-3 subunit delta